MDYFISAEDIVYHHWQLEFLIESLKLHNLEGNIVIALAENSEAKLINFISNLTNIKRVFFHANLGRKRNYLFLNSLYGLSVALSNKVLNLPFVILHPDMLLYKPLSLQSCDIAFQLNSQFTPEKFNLDNLIEPIIKEKKIEKVWVPVGNIKICNNVQIGLIERIIHWADILITLHPRSQFIENAAWFLGILEYYGHINLTGNYDYESTLLDNDVKNVIHYNHGLPPLFSKYMFTYTAGFSMGNLFETILQNGSTKAILYFQQIIKMYLKNKHYEKLNFTIERVTVGHK